MRVDDRRLSILADDRLSIPPGSRRRRMDAGARTRASTTRSQTLAMRRATGLARTGRPPARQPKPAESRQPPPRTRLLPLRCA
jgi:hypothetical protein